jgi:serine/threonine protein kinase
LSLPGKEYLSSSRKYFPEIMSSKEVIGALPIGTVVHSSKHAYKVLAVIGSGGFGITYKVIRQQDGCAFAMKEYYPSQMCERNAQDCTLSYLKTNSQTIKNGIEDFITEAKRLNKQNLSHPNLVTIDEVFKANNTAYYVMEFIDGCNLRQLISLNKEKPLPIDQALIIMRPILQAVALIHQNRLTHLDIKHENIIVTRQPDGTLRPVLIDFGQAKHYDKKGNATSKLTNAGCSDGFASPEQYYGLTKFTPQADVYALCATLLYLISAKQPVRSGEITAKSIHDMLPEGTSADIETAIVNGMRRLKDDRTQSVELLANALKLDISKIENNIIDDLPIIKAVKITYDVNKTKLITHNNIDFSKILESAGLLLATAAIAGGIIWFVNRPAPSQSQLLTEAIANKNANQLQQFADNDSARAFLPLANILISQGDTVKAKSYAQKALTFRPDSIDAKNLLGLLAQHNKSNVSTMQTQTENVSNSKNQDISVAETPSISYRHETNTGPAEETTKVESNDALFAKAKTISDYKSLADKGYSKAYAPLANLYLNNRNYKSADTYARKALAAGSNTSVAKTVVNTLDKLGYYDDSSNGEKPQ